MAEVIGEMLAGTDSAVPQQELDDLATVAREHVRWMFNISTAASLTDSRGRGSCRTQSHCRVISSPSSQLLPTSRTSPLI